MRTARRNIRDESQIRKTIQATRYRAMPRILQNGGVDIPIRAIISKGVISGM
jgi:hypothetical protein